MKVNNKTIVVIGGGSGMGRALTLLLRQKIANVVGIECWVKFKIGCA